MESSLEILSVPGVLGNGIRLFFKNSFIHAESDTQRVARATSACRSHSAPAVALTHITAEPPPITTLMIRNVPSRFSQQSLLKVIGAEFDVETIDFFYLPVDFKTGKCLGYCFVNFVSTEAKDSFLGIFKGAKLTETSNKVLSIDSAKVQGFEKNCNLFKSSSVMVVAPSEFRPMIQCTKCKQLVALASNDEKEGRSADRTTIICGCCDM